MSLPDIDKLSVEEKLNLMEQLWDSLCHEEVEPESPAWHEFVLAERKKMLDSPGAKFFTIEQVRERLR